MAEQHLASASSLLSELGCGDLGPAVPLCTSSPLPKQTNSKPDCGTSKFKLFVNTFLCCSRTGETFLRKLCVVVAKQ